MTRPRLKPSGGFRKGYDPRRSTAAQFKKGQSGNPRGGERKLIPTRDLATITELAARGVRQADISRALGLGLSGETWRKCLSEQPEVAEAYAEGQRRMHDSLVGRLFDAAMKGAVVPNLFLLKTRFGYREGDEPSELRPQITINLRGALSPEQYAAARREVIEHDGPAELPALTAPADDD
jgi:hypothetical protein